MTNIIDRTRWFFHPIVIFIFSIIALAASLTLYIYWYVEVSTGLREVVQEHNLDPSQFFEVKTWLVILILSILVGVILIGILIIFIYNIKTIQLYRLQYNFINSFTHELKTPVTSLHLYLETFMKHELPRDDQLKYLSYMLQDVERLLDNINRILNIAKIESKTYGGEIVEADLVQTVKQFYDNNIQMFRGCDIHVHSPFQTPLNYHINPPLFEMLLMNLLTNAIKYNESERPRVDVMFEQRNAELHIRFEDNGIGLEKKEIKKIFKKFYQVGLSENMSAKGSGLGLHLVQNIAKIHKGKIIAQSKGIGEGSIFSLILPFKK